MIGSSVVLFGIAAIFMRNQVRPIRKLALAAENLGKGQEVGDLKPSGATEVRQATFAFKIMRDRIKRQMQQRTEMLAGISHDLRTPLTRLKLEMAMLPSSKEVEEMKSDLSDMERMIESYLAFARGEGEEEPVLTSIMHLTEDTIANFSRDGSKINLIAANDDIQLPLRVDAMKRCLSNLVGNACRYGKQVEITIMPQGQAVEVRVEDDGPGIPAEAREEVFKPFRRLEESRNFDTGGIGLGLTIARDIARSHGGDIILGQSAMGGLRASLRLPL
jgi:two-component system osmolarity sensor histidine kinase EnvZ